METMRYSFIVLLIFLGSSASNYGWAQEPNESFIPNTVIFKVKSEYRSSCSETSIAIDELRILFESIQVTELYKKFPRIDPPAARERGRNGEELTDLSLIYELKYNSVAPLRKVISQITSSGFVEYAQPHHLQQTLFIPNDDSAWLSIQFHLNNIMAYAAWDVDSGDTNIVIGITDTGIDWDHPDLQGNIKYNYLDPIDGIDNDNDGYTDNYRGWDMSDNDNNPLSSGAFGHPGTLVAGLSAASTNNGIGIAGVGYKCKFLPIKVSSDAGSFDMAYEGIVYAAVHGCSIINCSWGNISPPGQFEIDVINFATINKDVLVVAAAGNDGNEGVFYPASIPGVLSVAGTDVNDVKFNVLGQVSNYGINIDVCAQGAYVTTTIFGGLYAQLNTSAGTSYSSPIVAGAAGIVRSRFPSYSALQVAEQLRVTADNIDTVYIDSTYNNLPFAGKLGSGRINLYRALTETSSPSIVMTQKNISGYNNGYYTVGDTVKISGVITNYLAPTSNLVVTASCTDTLVTILGGPLSLGIINTMGTISLASSPLMFQFGPSQPYNRIVEIKITYTDGPYTGFEYISFTFNPDYLNFEINQISTTVTSNGLIGYTDPEWPLQREGLGFMYKGQQLLYEAGLMIGATIGGTNYVSDNVRDTLDVRYNQNSDADFVRINAPVMMSQPALGDAMINVSFNDPGGLLESLNIKVDQRMYAWTAAPNDKYVISEYSLVNMDSSNVLSNLYAGIFADWDIMDYNLNSATYNGSNKMGYASSSQFGSPYVGIKLLSKDPVSHYALDRIPGGGGGIDIIAFVVVGNYTIYYDYLSSTTKYQLLSTQRPAAGENDIIDIVSTGPFTLNPGDTVNVAFALIAGDNLADLLLSAVAAQNKYDSIYYPQDTTGISNNEMKDFTYALYPNPAADHLSLVMKTNGQENFNLYLYNTLGTRVLHREIDVSNGIYYEDINISFLRSGMYYYKLESENYSEIGKINILR